ncbi:DUF2666 family protein [Candidatus Micrarchaeota archaeon]|nr:DUF2666 family protein [Candidatus Micrarchaeota archaeon]
MEEIAFSAKYRDWVVIKKMSIAENTSPPEVIHILSSICDTLNRKAFDFSGIDVNKIEEFIVKITKGKRKGFSTLADLFGSLKASEVKEVLLTSTDEQKLPVAEAYFIRRLLETLGYDLNISANMLSKMYPELKFSKPKGNFGKKKKSQ